MYHGQTSINLNVRVSINTFLKVFKTDLKRIIINVQCGHNALTRTVTTNVCIEIKVGQYSWKGGLYNGIQLVGAPERPSHLFYFK